MKNKLDYREHLIKLSMLNTSPIWFLLSHGNSKDFPKNMENDFKDIYKNDKTSRKILEAIRTLNDNYPRLSTSNIDIVTEIITHSSFYRDQSSTSVAPVEDVLVIPANIINAVTIRYPNDTYGVILNSSVVFYYTLVTQCIFAIITYDSPEPLTISKPKFFFYNAILALGAFATKPAVFAVVSYRDILLEFFEYCISEGIDESAFDNGHAIAVFILLHEYSHIDLNHFNKDNLEKMNFFGDEVEKYSVDLEKEIEADNLAYKWFSLGEKKRHETIMPPITTLFLFNSLANRINNIFCKNSVSNPPDEWFRWMELAKNNTEGETTGVLSNLISNVFEELFENPILKI